MDNHEINPLQLTARIGYWSSLLAIVFTLLHSLLYYPVIKFGLGPMEKFNVESYAMLWIQSGILKNGFLPQAAALIVMLLILSTSSCFYVSAPPHKKIFALLSLCFMIMANTSLSMGYFANWTCFPRSALAGDFSGLAQYTEGNINSFVFAILVLSFHILTNIGIVLLAPIFIPNKRDKIIGILFVIIGLSTIPSIISLATGIFPLLFIHDGIVSIAFIWASILLMGYWKRVGKTSMNV
jgi:hypothetical protein